jgi:hypothetical protein
MTLETELYPDNIFSRVNRLEFDVRTLKDQASPGPITGTGDNSVWSIIAGDGLSIAGTNDITIDVNPGYGIEIVADQVAVDASSDPGAEQRVLETTPAGGITLQELTVDNITLDGNAISTVAGNLNLSPTGDITLDPDGDDVLPGSGYQVNLGALSNKYLTLHAAELWVETLVAQDTMATIGGRILVGPTTELIADAAPGATTIDVKHNNLTNGDRVLMEADGKLEFMAITSSATGITDGFRYSVTRNLDGTGANQWYAGDAVFNTGQSGDGFIDLYSLSGVLSGAGPTIVGNVRNSGTYNDWTEHWAIGNLNGLYGYGTDEFGVGLGQYGTGSENYITIDPSSGLRFHEGSTVRAQLTGSVWTIGDTSAENIRIVDANIRLREGSTTHMLLTGSTLHIGQIANNQTRVVVDDTVGFRIIHRDGGGADNLLIQFDTSGDGFLKNNLTVDTGVITAGGGRVEIDSNGINITTTDGGVPTGARIRIHDDTFGQIGEFFAVTAGLSPEWYWSEWKVTGGGDEAFIQLAFDEGPGLNYINMSAEETRIAGDFKVDTNTLFVDASADRVGIGTGIPGEVFEINDGADTRLVIGTGTNNADTVTGIDFKGRYGQTFADGEIFAYIRTLRDGSGGRGHLTFGTSAATGSHATEKMRLDKDGNLGVGVDPNHPLDVNGSAMIRSNMSLGHTDAPAFRLDVRESVTSDAVAQIWNQGGDGSSNVLRLSGGQNSNPGHIWVALLDGDGDFNGYIQGDGAGGVNFTSLSDERIKEAVEPLATGALERVLALEPVTYRGKGAGPGGRRVTGLVAQQVREHVPDVVNQMEDDGLLGIGYGKLVPHLIGAIRELKGQKDSLQAELQKLRVQVDGLQIELDELEAA